MRNPALMRVLTLLAALGAALAGGNLLWPK
jgi:hypothetical protein